MVNDRWICQYHGSYGDERWTFPMRSLCKDCLPFHDQQLLPLNLQTNFSCHAISWCVNRYKMIGEKKNKCNKLHCSVSHSESLRQPDPKKKNSKRSAWRAWPWQGSDAFPFPTKRQFMAIYTYTSHKVQKSMNFWTIFQNFPRIPNCSWPDPMLLPLELVFHRWMFGPTWSPAERFPRPGGRCQRSRSSKVGVGRIVHGYCKYIYIYVYSSILYIYTHIYITLQKGCFFVL